MKNKTLKVNEIFKSIEGEGLRTGLPVVFIRLFGCNLKCSYCDTKYSCEGNDYSEMTIDDIMKKVSSFGIKNITLTGGEPLIHSNVESLIEELLNAGLYVNIETNGSVDCMKYLKYDPSRLMVTADFKCFSSGETEKMIVGNLFELRPTDVLKFVVGSETDLTQLKALMRLGAIKATVFVSPVFGKIDPVDIVNCIINDEELKTQNVRVQLQLHKFIWDPNKRGV